MTELVKSVNCVKYRFENISYSSVEASQIVIQADTNKMKLKNIFISTKVSLHKAYLSQVMFKLKIL